jgi:hypothetical protein
MSIKSFFDMKMHLKNLNKLTKKQTQTKTLIDQQIAFELCVDDIDPIDEGPDAGKYVIFNGEMVAQAILIAVQDKYNPLQKGFDKHYNISTINKIMRIARTGGASVILGHNEIKISYEKEAIMLKNAHKKVNMVSSQVRAGHATTANSVYNQHAAKEITAHTGITFDGDDHYSWFAFSCVVLAPDKALVDKVMSAIKAELVIGGVRFTLPRYGQLDAIRATIPFSTQINSKFLQRLNGRTIASMIPLRNDLAAFPTTGPIICVDEATGRPIKICPSKSNPENTFILSPPGSGKTVMICNLAGNAIANGNHVWIIEPKNEDADGTDYLNFCEEYGGSTVRFGPGGSNPNPLIIFYDKERMGDRPESYRKAKDDHFDVVENIFRAWIGGLNERQAGLLVKSLIDIYISREIIDADGNPINTDKWDVPGALAWPSIHELRCFWKDQYASKDSIYYKDPSIDALVMNTMKAEPGGTLWWWANNRNHIKLEGNLKVFDISQLPDNLKSAFCIWIMGACNTLYFPKLNDGTERIRTYLIFDEVGKLSKTPELVPYMERCLREGRAPAVTGVFATQDPILDEKFVEMIKANCKNLFILNNLDDMNIDTFMKAFNLKDQYRSRLMQKGTGIGLYMRNRVGTNIRIELDEMKDNALLNSKRGSNQNVVAPTLGGHAVDEFAREIYETEKFFITDWLIGKTQSNYPGFTYYNTQDPFSTGSFSAWIQTDLIKKIEGLKADGTEKQDLVGPESIKHFSESCIIAVWLKQHKFPNVQIHHSDNADVTWDGGCIEIEVLGTHNKVEDWNKKLDRAQASGHTNIIFTGTGDVCREMRKKGSLVKGFVFPNGSSLLKQLEKIRDENFDREPRNLVGFSAVSAQTEV